MQTESLQILLSDMKFHAYHGVMPQEREIGGDYLVSVCLEVSQTQQAVDADALEGTVDYSRVYQRASAVMATPSELLENVAGRLLRSLFSLDLRIRQAEVSITKCCPPMPGYTGSATCRLSARSPFAERLRLAILDFDGTLADTSDGIVRTMSATFDAHHLPAPSSDAICRTIGLPLSQSIALLTQGDGAQTEDMVATYRQLFEEIGTKHVTLFSGVSGTLATLRSNGVKIAIATSRGHRSVAELCGNLGIAHLIDMVVAEDDVKEKKPAPEAVRRILTHMQLCPNEALVVGDTTFDVTMGQAAGCPTLAVTYGNHDRQTLDHSGADIVCDRFADLLPLFR